jgi:putative flippase GtrA
MLLWLFIEVLHFGAELSRLASAALSFVVNFSVRKLILFSKKKT